MCLFVCYSVNSKGAVLSNYEVYTLLQEVCQQGSKGKRNITKTQAHLANIAFDVSVWDTWAYVGLRTLSE